MEDEDFDQPLLVSQLWPDVESYILARISGMLWADAGWMREANESSVIVRRKRWDLLGAEPLGVVILVRGIVAIGSIFKLWLWFAFDSL